MVCYCHVYKWDKHSEKKDVGLLMAKIISEKRARTSLRCYKKISKQFDKMCKCNPYIACSKEKVDKNRHIMHGLALTHLMKYSYFFNDLLT